MFINLLLSYLFVYRILIGFYKLIKDKKVTKCKKKKNSFTKDHYVNGHTKNTTDIENT